MAKRAAETYRGYRRNHEPEKRRCGRAQILRDDRKSMGWTKAQYDAWISALARVNKRMGALGSHSFDELNPAFTTFTSPPCEDNTQPA